MGVFAEKVFAIGKMQKMCMYLFFSPSSVQNSMLKLLLDSYDNLYRLMQTISEEEKMVREKIQVLNSLNDAGQLRVKCDVSGSYSGAIHLGVGRCRS